MQIKLGTATSTPPSSSVSTTGPIASATEHGLGFSLQPQQSTNIRGILPANATAAAAAPTEYGFGFRQQELSRPRGVLPSTATSPATVTATQHGLQQQQFTKPCGITHWPIPTTDASYITRATPPWLETLSGYLSSQNRQAQLASFRMSVKPSEVQGSMDKGLSVASSDPASFRALQDQLTKLAAMARATAELAMAAAQQTPERITSMRSLDAVRSPRFDSSQVNPPRVITRYQPQFASMTTTPNHNWPAGTMMVRDQVNTTEIAPSLSSTFRTPNQTRGDAQRNFTQSVSPCVTPLSRESAGSPHASPTSSKRPTPMDKAMEPTVTGIPHLEGFEGMRSNEDWRKARTRLLSRLRKRRWRAKKKAEVLLGVEHVRLEEEERRRRDRIRKQQDRIKRLEAQSSGDDAVEPSSTLATVFESLSSSAASTSEPIQKKLKC